MPAAAVPVDLPPALAVPGNPPAIVREWHLENPGDTVGAPDADVDAASAWEVTIGDRAVIVAVIDTGVDVLHPLLADAIVVNAGETPGNGLDDDGNGLADDVTGWDFADGDGDTTDAGIAHGTLVAGLVASAVHGIAPGAGILPIKVFSTTGFDVDFEQAAADGILYALDRGARVLQISWELGTTPPGAALMAAFEAADAQGALVVIGAGNSGEDLDVTPIYPAALALPNIITVAGSNRYDEPVNLAGLFVTNRGAATVELAAPTEKVRTTFPGGGTLGFTGTSASAPIVSGIVALTWSANPALTAAEVKACVLDGVDVLPQLEGVVATSGRANAANAVRCAAGVRIALREVRNAEPDRPTLFDATTSQRDGPPLLAIFSFADGSTPALSNSLSAEHRFDTGGQWPVTIEVIATNGARSLSRTTTTVPFRWIPTPSSVQSAHPYAAGTQLVTSVRVPGARWIRLHFTQVATGGNDAFLLFDGARGGVASYQGAFTDLTSEPIRGDTAFLYLRGFTGGEHGFTLDRIDAQFAGDVNHTPIARVSGAVGARIGAPATFYAEGSSDPDGDALTYTWRLLSAPETSTATLSDTTGPDTSLTPDAEGEYAIVLTVTDTHGASHSTLAWLVTRPNDGSSCAITTTRSASAFPFALLLLPVVLFWYRRPGGGRAALLTLCFLPTACIHAPPTGATPPLRHTAITSDGWRLALHHYPTPEGAPARARPLLLCHGLGSNHHSLDLDEGASLARHLAAQGFDVWSVDLRGHGESRTAPASSRTRAGRRSFDDHVRLDAPALVAYVLSQTRAPDLTWVGHSMGGMIGYAYAGTNPDTHRLGGLVAIASPGSVRGTGLIRTVSAVSAPARILPQLHARPIGRAHAAVFGGWVGFHLDNLVYNRANLTARERKLLGGTALENLSRAEVKQFRTWMKTNTFVSGDGKDDYAAALERITIPALLISGTSDFVVPPPSVQFVMIRLASSDKTHRTFGRSEGDPVEWGHVDLVAGRRANAEVFPVISAWLAQHDPFGCAPELPPLPSP